MRRSVGQPTPPYAEGLSQLSLGELEEGSFVFYGDINGVNGVNGVNGSNGTDGYSTVSSVGNTLTVGNGTVASGSYSHTTGMGNVTLPTSSDSTPSDSLSYMNSGTWVTPGVHTLESDFSTKSSTSNASELLKGYMNTKKKKSKTFNASLI